ncbi:MAG: hydrogenase [Desulfobacteraceae bacterium]|nr:MAG: hydrogenase [Desulfobacteraceae bacterium]
MEAFFFSIGVIIAGGTLPLMLHRHFTLMKTVGVLSISAGCLIGLTNSLFQLFRPETDAVSFKYLHAFSLSFVIDGLSAFFLVPVFFVSFLAALYSFHYLNTPEKSFRTAASYLFFSLLIASMTLVVTAANIITFMLFWEIMSLSSFFLVVYDYHKIETRKAGYLYFVFSHAGAMLILSAFGLMYGFSGSFGFDGAAILPEWVKIVVFVLAFAGFGSKAGVFPFHVWLPHAHPAAPSHISAVMSGVMIKIGIYGILRMYVALNYHAPLFGEILVIAGMISGILGVVYALAQQDIKRMLAYSSIENMGIILIGLGIGMIGMSSGNPLMAVLGFAGSLLHVLNHSIFKSLLFMGAGIVIKKTGTHSIDALGGLMKKMRITGMTFLIGSLAISGLPPLNGFVGEFFIYLGGFKGVGLDKLSFVLSLMAIISLAVIGGLALACFTKVVGVVFQGEPRSESAVKADEKEPMMLIPMVVLAALCPIIGVFPKAVFLMAIRGVSALNLGYGRIPFSPFLEMTENISQAAAVFLLIVFCMLALRFFLYRQKTITRTGTWGCGFTRPTVKMQYTGSSYARSITDFFKPVTALNEDHPAVQGVFPAKTYYSSHARDIAERYMESVFVHPVLFFFDKLRWIQQGDIHPYIGYILLAIVILLFFV